MRGETIFLAINLLLALVCFFQEGAFFRGVGVFLVLEGVIYYYYSKSKEK